MGKIFRTHLIAAIALALFSTVAFADHDNPGQSDYFNLANEAQQLNSVVQWSYLRPNVKRTVSRFTYLAQQLSSCPGSGLPVNPVAISRFEHGGGQCAGLINQVERTWRQIERFLDDTQYDFPQVYQQYQVTHEAAHDAGF